MLAERIGARLGAATVFGTPVERDGVTPPSPSRDSGSAPAVGTDPGKGQEGEGGGAGGAVTPTGYIELKDGRSRFVPVVHPTRMLALVLSAVMAAILIMRSPRVERRARKLPWS
jgi:uncharacterized spore protein YtfJ